MMSTDYRPLTRIFSTDLFDGRLEAFGVREHFNKETTETERVLTDGRDYLWVYVKHGFAGIFTRYYPNGGGLILNAIAEAFDVDIVSEYEPRFWGFDTQEEWDAADAAWDAMRKADDEKFHTELLKFLQGEPHDITPGIRMERAEIAKKLVEEDPALLLPTNKSKLHVAIAIYEREHDPDVPF
jgi:hypothetical protein